jgi:lysophospholipase L1-like esterase
MAMRFKILLQSLLITLLVSFASSCGGGGGGGSTVAEAATEQSLEKLPGTLIIVGDSIMAGCINSANQPNADYSMTTAHLVAQQGVRVVNLSRPGNTIALADTQRVDGGISFTQISYGGTAIWIALGGNDFLAEASSLQQYRDRYLTVLSRIKPIPAQKIFCATPLISGLDYDHRITSEGATYEDYRQVVRDIAAEGHCALVDTSQWFDATDVYDDCNMPDTVHLGEDGHTRYSNNLLKEIRGDYSAL